MNKRSRRPSLLTQKWPLCSGFCVSITTMWLKVLHGSVRESFVLSAIGPCCWPHREIMHCGNDDTNQPVRVWTSQSERGQTLELRGRLVRQSGSSSLSRVLFGSGEKCLAVNGLVCVCVWVHSGRVSDLRLCTLSFVVKTELKMSCVCEREHQAILRAAVLFRLKPNCGLNYCHDKQHPASLSCHQSTSNSQPVVDAHTHSWKHARARARPAVGLGGAAELCLWLLMKTEARVPESQH